jgi:thymidylate kinase
VRQGYLALVENQPERIEVIDGRGAIAEVARSIQEAMRKIV